ncbi:deaminase [Actinotalea ferrariae CF5-4]|uniref:Deaminase n=1 Tax=Actinotalea ferrariae CF5-4 TaxID=948458 RepID=A0A021VNI2_9CELL|nr:dihydrofolate reductase family protein [Actinotalea ferrariae]EYR62711.1 deaminase [Actinotalea ferrariae CF5-4]
MEPAPVLDVLLPAGRTALGPDPAERALSELYAYPDGRWVRANMITTLDGAATGADGRSGSINGAADHRVFDVLRGLADVILVGAGTARAERYRGPRTPPPLVPARRASGQADHPPLAVVTGRGDLPAALLDDEPRPWVFTVPEAPFLGHLRAHLPKDRLHLHEGGVDPRRVLDTLAGAGLVRVLCEGGPRLLADLVAADVLDELCLTQTPAVVGGPATRVVHGQRWADPVRAARPAHLLHADGVLIGRWLLERG